VRGGGGVLAEAAVVLTFLFRLFAREGFLEGEGVLAASSPLLVDISEKKISLFRIIA
jgi:hypothetical protein